MKYIHIVHEQWRTTVLQVENPMHYYPVIWIHGVMDLFSIKANIVYLEIWNSTKTVSGHNDHKPKRPRPKRPQTETAKT